MNTLATPAGPSESEPIVNTNESLVMESIHVTSMNDVKLWIQVPATLLLLDDVESMSPDTGGMEWSLLRRRHRFNETATKRATFPNVHSVPTWLSDHVTSKNIGFNFELYSCGSAEVHAISHSCGCYLLYHIADDLPQSVRLTYIFSCDQGQYCGSFASKWRQNILAVTMLGSVPVVNVMSVLSSVAVSATSAGVDAVPAISVSQLQWTNQMSVFNPTLQRSEASEENNKQAEST